MTADATIARWTKRDKPLRFQGTNASPVSVAWLMARGDAPVQFTESDNSEIVGREEAEQPPGVPRAVLYGERRNTVVAKNSFRCVVSGCRSLAQGQYSTRDMLFLLGAVGELLALSAGTCGNSMSMPELTVFDQNPQSRSAFSRQPQQASVQ